MLKTYNKLLLRSIFLAALAGGVGGATTAVLLISSNWIQQKIWGEAILRGFATERGLGWCLLSGIIIGIILTALQYKQAKASLPELPETLRELNQKSQGIKDEQSGRQLVSGALALIGGGSVGPEALMTRVMAVAAHRVWRGQDKSVIAAAMAGSLGLFGSPLVGGTVLAGRNWQLIWRWLPGTIGGLTGFLAFHGINSISKGLDGVQYTLPRTSEEIFPTLLSACLGALIGSLSGAGLIKWRQWLHRLELMQRYWFIPIFTGCILGLALWCLPLAGFSGEEQLRPMMLGYLTRNPNILIFSGIVKLLLVGLCLETGWRGGQFFPVILASSAIGMGLHEIMPHIGTLDSWIGGSVGGSLAILLDSPLLVLILGISLLQGHGAAALLVGLVIGKTQLPWNKKT